MPRQHRGNCAYGQPYPYFSHGTRHGSHRKQPRDARPSRQKLPSIDRRPGNERAEKRECDQACTHNIAGFGEGGGRLERHGSKRHSLNCANRTHRCLGIPHLPDRRIRRRIRCASRPLRTEVRLPNASCGASPWPRNHRPPSACRPRQSGNRSRWYSQHRASGPAGLRWVGRSCCANSRCRA